MKRVLVTGATGFIGRHSLPALQARGYEVHAVTSRPVVECAGIRWHRFDLLDPEQCRGVVNRVKPTHLLHFAWYTEPGRYWTSAKNLDWVAASIILIKSFVGAGGGRCLIAGTCAEYAWFDHSGVCSETTTPLQPSTLYGTSKDTLRAMVAAYAPLVGLSWAWGRSFSVYGPHEHHSRLVASVARNLVLGQAASCSAGTAVRDYLHVADMAEAFVAVLDGVLQGPVNIASGQGQSLSEIALRVADIYGRPDLLELGTRPESIGEPPVLIGDALRLREIGWKPRYTLDEGLADVLAWWRRKLNVEQDR